MYTTARSVGTMDNATFQLIGAGSLDDTSSIESAISETEKLMAGAQQYLATLNEQGIKVNEDEDEDAGDDLVASDLAEISARGVSALDSALVALQDADFGPDGDFDEYEKHLETASDFDILGALRVAMSVATGGSWIDAAGALVAGNVSIFNLNFGAHVTSPAAASIREKVPGAKQNLLSMVSGIEAMAKTAKEWADRLPHFPKSQDDVEQAEKYQKASIGAAVKTISLTAKANNSFLDLTRMAQHFRDDMQLKVNQAKDQLARVSAARDADWNDFKNRGLNNLVPNAILRPDHDRMWGPRLRDHIMRVQQLEVDLCTGLACHDQAMNLQQLCESSQGHLGAMYNLMTSIRYNIEEDALAYEQLLHGQWLVFAKHIQDIRSSLGDYESQGDEDFAGLEDLEVGPGAASAALIEALSPARGLGSNIRTQAQDAAAIDRGIADVKTIPFAEDIVVKLDATGEKSMTLAQVVLDMRTAYSEIMAYEYEVVSQFSVLATLQKVRLEKLQQGRLTISVMLNSTKVSLAMAVKAANQASSLHEANALQFESSMLAAEKSVKEIKVQLADTKVKLSKSKKEYKDRVIGIILYAGFNGFLAGALVASVLYGVVAAPAIGAGSAIIPGLTGAVSLFGGGDDDEGGEDATPEKEPKKDAKPKEGKPKPKTTPKQPGPGPKAPNQPKPESEKHKHKDEEATNGDDPAEREESEEDEEANLIKHTAEDAEVEETEEEEGDGEKDAKNGKAGKVEKVKSAVKEGQKAWGKFMAIRAQVKSQAMTTEFGRSVFGDTSLEALSIIVAALQSACATMEKAIERLEVVRPPLMRLEKTVDAILEDAKAMNAAVKKQLGVYDKGSSVQVAARPILQSWHQIAEASTAWLDVMNEQGITPIVRDDWEY